MLLDATITYTWSQALADVGEISPIATLTIMMLFAIVVDLALKPGRRGGAVTMVAATGYTYALATAVFRWVFYDGGPAYSGYANPAYAYPAYQYQPVAAPVRTVTTVQQPAARQTTRLAERAPRRDWKKTALVIGGSTATGAGVGAVFGGKKGALIGAAIGGGASTIYESTK